MPGRVLAQSRSNVDNGVTRQVADVGLIKAAHTSIRLAALVVIGDRRVMVHAVHDRHLPTAPVAEFQDKLEYYYSE